MLRRLTQFVLPDDIAYLVSQAYPFLIVASNTWRLANLFEAMKVIPQTAVNLNVKVCLEADNQAKQFGGDWLQFLPSQLQSLTMMDPIFVYAIRSHLVKLKQCTHITQNHVKESTYPPDLTSLDLKEVHIEFLTSTWPSTIKILRLHSPDAVFTEDQLSLLPPNLTTLHLGLRLSSNQPELCEKIPRYITELSLRDIGLNKACILALPPNLVTLNLQRCGTTPQVALEHLKKLKESSQVSQ